MTKEEATQRLIDMGIIPATAATATAPATASVVQKTPPATVPSPAKAEESKKPHPAKTEKSGDAGLDASELAARLTKPIEKTRCRVSAAAVKFVEDLSAFLSEWKVNPSARMVSTFALAARQGRENGRWLETAKDYLVGRFAVSKECNDFAAELEKKCESQEFQRLAETAGNLTAKKLVNSRLALFYGERGGGKSTFAKTVLPTIEHYLCTEDRRSLETIADVKMDFESQKKGFVWTSITRAMEAGRPVILDEINLLDDAVLASFQQMTDDTETVEVAGNTFHIRPGFLIIGTFNLETALGLRPLPEALVDRAMVIRKFNQPSAKERAAWAGLE